MTKNKLIFILSILAAVITAVLGVLESSCTTNFVTTRHCDGVTQTVDIEQSSVVDSSKFTLKPSF